MDLTWNFRTVFAYKKTPAALQDDLGRAIIEHFKSPMAMMKRIVLA